ncbi:MAG: hypothetical protein GX087_02015 [Desulfobulbaceae bacterium]|nr:hypothetical protein [Desulfobulbaceae bacterium]
MTAHETNQQKAAGTISNEVIFKVAKEIVVKFIEVGKLSPSGFEETFTRVYQTIERTVRPK